MPFKGKRFRFLFSLTSKNTPGPGERRGSDRKKRVEVEVEVEGGVLLFSKTKREGVRQDNNQKERGEILAC